MSARQRIASQPGRTALSGPCPSKSRYLERGHIFHAHGLSRIERLSVTAANERAVMCGVMPDQLVERLPVRVDLSGLDRLDELGLVASDRLEFFLERFTYVDDERRLLVVFAK